MSRGRSHPLDRGIPPPWACGWGEDKYGVFVEFEIGGVEQRMRWIPPGEFMMGSPEDEEGRWDDEGPRHSELIEEGFWLADTLCTQALWEAVMGKNPSRFKGGENPVERVSWEDCKRFFESVDEHLSDLSLRFPTEAEWEYACRAGSAEARYGEIDEIAWYRENSEKSTHPVKQKKPNAWGLYDTLGSVFEWCEDLWRSTYDAEPTGSARVYRGGSWLDDARFVRAAYRYGYDPSDRYDFLGFRFARGQSLLQQGAEPQEGAERPGGTNGDRVRDEPDGVVPPSAGGRL